MPRLTPGLGRGAFFGNPVDAEGNTLMGNAAYPLSVAGEFDAQSSHGAVAGAFGAERDD